jgi:hypothetical protein
MEENKEMNPLDKFVSEATKQSNQPKLNEEKINLSGYNDGGTLNYITVDLSVLPAGMFYKPGTLVMIRSASVAEVQAYSAVDDNNFLDVTDKMNEILSRCVKIKYPGGLMGTYKDLKDNDRLFLIFMIRELTFQKNSNLAKDVTCQSCKTEFKIQFRSTPGLDSPKTFVNYEMDPELEEFFNPQDRTFDFVIGDKLWKLAPPCISLQEIFFTNIKEKVQASGNPNVSFLKIIPFTLWDRKSITEEGIKAKEKEFESLDMDTFLFLDEVVGKMLYGIKEMMQVCPSCGEEVHTDMTFPKGASSIFKPGISIFDRFRGNKK